jgi:hypothetical protein
VLRVLDIRVMSDSVITDEEHAARTARRHAERVAAGKSPTIESEQAYRVLAAVLTSAGVSRPPTSRSSSRRNGSSADSED